LTRGIVENQGFEKRRRIGGVVYSRRAGVYGYVAIEPQRPPSVQRAVRPSRCTEL
jgi:hypothetical protein